MPNTPAEAEAKAEASARGLKKIRTVKLPNGKYAHVYVVKKAGPEGGHTVMGEPQTPKG